MDVHKEDIERHDDHRGKLIVFLKGSDLPEEFHKFGEIFWVTFSKKSVVRGNHYHKNWREWFAILSGKVRLVLEDIRTKKRSSIILDAKKRLVRVEVGPYIAHAFQALSSNVCLLNYSVTEWSPDDVYHYQLIPTPDTMVHAQNRKPKRKREKSHA